MFGMLAMLLLVTPAHARQIIAGEAPDTTKLHVIEEVVVAAANRYKLNIESVVPVQTLSGDELERLSVLSVADAVRYFSGVQIKDYGGIGGLKTVNIRSMGTQHVGVFYDGVQLGNAQNGQIDLGRFSLDNMEAISLYNGQKSDIFQSAKDFASSGAIYMTARRPSFAQGMENNLNFKFRTGSFDLLNASTLWERRFGEKLSSSSNVEFLNTSGKYKFRYQKTGGYDTTEVRRNGDVTFLRAEAALFGGIRQGEWRLKGYYYNSARGYPGAAVKQDSGIALLNEDQQKDRNLFIQGSLQQEVSKFYSYKIQAKYANDYMNYVMPPYTTGEPTDNDFWQRQMYAAVANLFSLSRWWTANVSADLQWDCLDADGSEMFNKNFVEPRRRTFLGAAATSLQLKRFSLQGSLLYTFVHDISARGYTVAGDKNVFTPTAIVSYRPWTNVGLDIRAFYKNIFRMPTFNDLYYVRLGNRLLKPEYTTQYDIGAAYLKRFHTGFLATVNASADAYFNQVKDKIIATPTSNQLVWTMINLGYVEIRGVDLAAGAEMRAGRMKISARLTYTYQKAQDFTDSKRPSDDEDATVDNFYGDQIPYIPWHAGSAILGVNYRNWSFNYSFIYTGERYMLGGNVPVNHILPWYTSDVSLSRNVDLKRCALRITAEVNNLFNQQYDVVKWYPMPGTNFRITLSLTI